jgi:flavin-dependent dehydrogenase
MATLIFDVAIIGSGLAGNLLARQLRRTLPHLTVGMFEKNTRTSFKVGESTVEIAGNHLLRKLGLSSYLYDHQLPKNGLRFFFDCEKRTSELTRMSEIGSVALPYHPSFQLDRARFEADLHGMNREDGIDVYLGAHVETLTLSASGRQPDQHHFVVKMKSQTHHGRCRWIIDATGRSSLIARQKNLRVPEQDHELGAVWGRFFNVNDIDAMGPDLFQKRVRYTSRRLSTTHFCYPGYWIWFIPLGKDVTSIGVVTDRSASWRDRLRKQKGFLEFLKEHHAVGSLLTHAECIDIGSYGQLAYGTRQYFSGDRWALTGEAAAFTDPFYSPGSDFIALENDFITDLIRRDEEGEADDRRHALANLYSAYMSFRYEASMRLYRSLYSTLGSYALMKLKWQLDFPLYYHMWLSQYMQDLHLKEEFLLEQVGNRNQILNALSNFSHLFKKLEGRMKENGDYFRLNEGGFTNALEGMEWTDQVGISQGLHQELKRLNEIFNANRQQALDLLEVSQEENVRRHLSLSQFLVPHALA